MLVLVRSFLSRLPLLSAAREIAKLHLQVCYDLAILRLLLSICLLRYVRAVFLFFGLKMEFLWKDVCLKLKVGNRFLSVRFLPLFMGDFRLY